MITEADIAEFLTAKLEELSSQVPGYSALNIEANRFQRSQKPSIQIQAYNEFTGHTSGSTFDMAIAETVKLTGGRTEAEMLRAKAAGLISQAEKLEGKEGE